MLKSKIVIATFLIVAVFICVFSVRASGPNAAASEVVEYRLKAWKTTHAEGAKADKLVGTLKKLRCEVKVGSHGGHTDVKYRCEKWQSLALKDHKTAHQWQAWLKRYGFETKHKH